ncbi:nitrogenase-stabilizing/protective protein NifW [Oscillatoria sp. FACHB-1407]|uniref:nitrogenase-stabilizing/protective protein NifW n=1 Tax=Oscillatoria sp. FACHB-1407 TaxID=2692847 RepID=UPI00168963E2|nr:nitrogenase-stabilizing/protective protein NifW [Oscillatoria sp. FACHB-1407]MBD2459885.1 nitrogenase-stabilizing/protective protein NifW [Oscillatoria sp. FACHB-1407]
MANTLTAFHRLTDAEQYFEFFNLPYDRTIVNINRLHILKQFSNAMKQIDTDLPDLTESDRLNLYRTALVQAYELFSVSTGVEQKLFKVFHDKPRNVVLLSQINTGD